MARAAKTAKGGSAQSARGGGSVQWLLGMVCGAVLAFATPTALLAGVLLAPAILTAVFDRQPKRPITRVVFVSCAGFTFGPVWHLNSFGASLGQAVDMLADPAVLCPAWLAGACGWAVCELLPLLLYSLADRQATGQVAALIKEAESLQAAWDLDG